MGAITRIQSFLRFLYATVYGPFAVSHFALDTFLYTLPWARPVKGWSFHQAVRVRVVKLALLIWSTARSVKKSSLRPGAERNRFEVLSPMPVDHYKGPSSDTLIEPAPVGVTWTPARPPPRSLVRSTMTVVLHFHGGAYVIGNGRDEDTGFLAGTFLRHMGCTHVCTPQYRLASGENGRFPAPLQDALTVYLALLREKGIPAEQIILSGDSAGANLALGLLRYIHEHGKEQAIPAPGAVALWSPWVDIDAALTTDMRKSPNYKTDYLSRAFGRWGAMAISGSKAVDPADPYLSPLHHPFKLGEAIPMFIHEGEREVLSDDIRLFSQRHRDAGWAVHLVTSPNAPHDIILLGPRIGFAAEAEQAAREAGKFFAGVGGMQLRNAD
ncbi:uncharacterized protein E0L32_004113 [Thyridium curvatum]|uniref:Alpha/beta hydrolase fold-3 domain-containing protein n=1 Tax=Thyridium curvatum TaxID=1093900 RepID=A0A507BHA7_9PEZI|nr:uncharacterized protein E0L32_004113 [Thyridium curvatum]TPX16118.1 hypothetical protein E0L32_004113 [Thyridium curvatum]